MRRFLILVCLCFAALSAFAQAPPLPKMTWVRYYEIERGKDADFMRLVSETFKPVLDDLQKKGKVLEWGVGIPLTMNGEPWTHALYMAMPDWSGVEALDQAIDAAQAASTPQAAQRIAEQSMSVAQSRDVILRHLVQSTTQPKAKPKYIIAETHKIKPAAKPTRCSSSTTGRSRCSPTSRRAGRSTCGGCPPTAWPAPPTGRTWSGISSTTSATWNR